MLHSIETYLSHDPYDLVDRDVDVRNRKTKVLKTRAPQTCVPPTGCDTHEIAAGTMAWMESAFVEGVPARCYVCLHHMDAWIEEVTSNA